MDLNQSIKIIPDTLFPQKLDQNTFAALKQFKVPTITLLIIAEITLHFDESKTEMAIGLSLTIMLVMYTMYQSISESLIKTAYLKVIDYWLLFCLLMPFVIFMIEIYWLLKKNHKLEATAKGWITDSYDKAGHRKIIQYVVHGLTLVYIIIYIIIGAVLYFELN